MWLAQSGGPCKQKSDLQAERRACTASAGGPRPPVARANAIMPAASSATVDGLYPPNSAASKLHVKDKRNPCDSR